MGTKVASVVRLWGWVGALALMAALPAAAADINGLAAKANGTPKAAVAVQKAQQDMAAAAGISSGQEKMAVVASGDCGFATRIFGCPAKGVVRPPNMPELETTLNSLMGLANASGSTSNGRLGLLLLGDRLSKISPEKLTAQLEVMKKADPAYQFGAVRQVQFPMAGDAIKNPVRHMETMIDDARGKGTKFQDGAKKSLAFLKQIQSRAKTKKQKAFLQGRIDNLTKLINSGAIPMAAKQAIAPFFDGKGNPKLNPKNNQPVTTKQAAITMMMMGVEEGMNDSEDNKFHPAQIRSQRDMSLEDFE